MKRWISLGLTALLSIALLAGCATEAPAPAPAPAPAAPSAPAPTPAAPSFDTSKEITVVSREEGSGTRGAFIELMGVEEKDAAGNKTDKTTEEAVIANSTDVVMTNVAGNPYAIGYISLGSLNNTVKALKVDGVDPTAANIKAGTYKVSRPFNVATKGAPSGLAKDFLDFIMSAEGQKIIGNGYIPVDDAPKPYAGNKPSGKIVVAGSSSVTPIMEKLKEGYLAINSGASIEIQMSDSTAGMTSAMEGTCDIGMASRELKDSEKAVLTPMVIALDGIAMVVNNENTLSDITPAAIKSIYVGETTTWDKIK